MAKVELQKIRIAGLKDHYEILIKELQRRGVMHIKSNPSFSEESSVDLDSGLVDDFDLAKVDFAINLLTPYATKKGKMESMLTGGRLIMPEKDAKDEFENFETRVPSIVEECEKIEEFLAKSKNDIASRNKKIARLKNFAEFTSLIGEDLDTLKTKTVVGVISTSKKESFLGGIAMVSNLVDIDIFNEGKRDNYFRLTYAAVIAKEIEEILSSNGFNEIDLGGEFEEFKGKMPAEVLISLEESVVNLENKVLESDLRKKELAANLDSLKIVYDFYSWKKDKDDLSKNVFRSKYLFAFEAWMPKEKYSAMEHWIKQVFVGDVSIEAADDESGERVPALLKNKGAAKSFEMITEMYGSPKGNDIDPTPGLTPFFVTFFGICLSDTGYGMILFFISSFFLLFSKFSKEARTSLWMIFLLGVSATVGGVLLGGHFGMTPDQAPGFLTTVNSMGELVFRGQILDPMKGTGAMTFLLATFGIGLFHLLFGLVMEFMKHWKNKDYISAFADSAAWLFFMLALVGWSLAEKVGLPKDIMYYLMMTGMGILVVTQGRAKTHSNPIVSFLLKLVFGILGLYGIMDYVSSMLSYSRLMALGLATGIIGSAMNMTAVVLGDMLPGAAGIVLMIAFLIFGHSINFGLSSMGAFIHSMRLQFIEFFGVFYTGGAESFKPFTRVKKYLLFRS